MAVRRSVFDSEERETPCRGKAGAVLPVNGLAKKSGKKGTKKISRCARNDSVGDGYPVHHTKNVWEKHVSRIVIPSEVEGSFSLAVRRSVFDSEERETPCRGKAGAVLPVNGLAKKSGKKGTKKISRCARNDSVGDGYPVHHTKNVWEKHVSRIVIPSEVEGSFSLAVRRSVFDSEERETPCRGKAGAVLPVNGLAKKSGKKGTKKISRCARNDSVGNGYPVHHTKNAWETRSSRIVIPSGAEGSFSLAVRRSVFDSEERETPCRGKAGAVLPVNGLAKKSGKKGTKKISRCARNDSVGDGYPVHHTKNVWEKHVSRIVIPSEVEGSFSLAVRRSVFDSEERETPCRGKAGAVLPVNGLAKKSGKKGTKKISRCARNDSVGDGYPVHHTKNV